MSFPLNYKLGAVVIALSGAFFGLKCSVSHFKIDLITAVCKASLLSLILLVTLEVLDRWISSSSPDFHRGTDTTAFIASAILSTFATTFVVVYFVGKSFNTL